ncbi:MAG: hypothetical protein ACK5TN_20965 [Acidobacteriota bacterium]
MPKPICDFCSSPDVAFVDPVRTFAAYVFDGIVGESVGDWAACPICHGLIESDRPTDLVERSLVTVLERQPETKFVEHELRDCAKDQSAETVYLMQSCSFPKEKTSEE